MKSKFIQTFENAVYDNDFDTNDRAYVPEVWAQESLMILEENMVMANLVHRDFEDEIQEFGDVVNTRRPGSFTAKRKGDNDDVTVQDATADKVQIPLNQYLHTSFKIRDGQMSKSFKDLVNEFLRPAIVSIAQGVDQIILAQMHQFQANSCGKLGTDPTRGTVIAANTVLNNNSVPLEGRNMVVTPNAEGALLDIGEFIKANEVGDDGTAMRNAWLGTKFGFDFFMSQNAPSIDSGSVTTESATVDGAASKGATSITYDGYSGTITAGSWVTFAGDATPQFVKASTSSILTIEPGLKRAVEDGAVITIYPTTTQNDADGDDYDANYYKSLTVTALTDTPQRGQIVTSGTTTGYNNIYGLIDASTKTSLTLDRPLGAEITNGATIGLGPAGEFCFGFHPNAIALISRPLAAPPADLGVRSAVVNFGGLSIRLTITYDGNGQGVLVTADLLMGVKVLDTDLGVLMYA